MPTKYFILPYKMTSESAKDLGRELNATRVYPDRNYRGRAHHILINWGYSGKPSVPVNNCKEILNKFESVKYVTDKLKFFQYNSTARKVQALFNKQQVLTTMRRSDKKFFCRTIINGKGGEGIVLAKTPDEVVDAPLYTEGIIGGTREYRIHIFKNKVFHIQQKRKMTTEKLRELGITHQSLIRNYNNGYTFTITDIVPPSEDTIKQALQVIQDYELDFGAVDIIESKAGAGYVLEINSAPGLEGTTLAKYTEIFKEYLRQL